MKLKLGLLAAYAQSQTATTVDQSPCESVGILDENLPVPCSVLPGFTQPMCDTQLGDDGCRCQV